MRRSAALAGVSVLTTLAVAACGGGGSGGKGTAASGSEAKAAASGGTVHVLQTADYSHLDPVRGWDGGVNNFYRLIYRGLTTFGAGPGKEGTKVVPDLATSTGTPSDGNKTWTFTLKDDIFFEDGTPITSEAMKFGVERAWDPDAGIGSPYAKLLIDAPKDYKGPYVTGDLDTIETPDPKTIVFHLKKPFADFASALVQPNFVPFPKGTGAGGAFDAKPIASGPYKVESYQRGAKLKLVRNPHWKAATDTVRAAKPDSYEITFGIDGATIDERMLAGQGADASAIAGAIQPATVARIQDPRYKARTLSGYMGCTTYMSLNTTKKPLDDVKVRQAINYAINKDNVVAGDGGTTLATKGGAIQPPTIVGRLDYDPYPTDPAKAKALLAEAGQGKGFDLTLDVRPVPRQQGMAVAIQESLKPLGINVKINNMDTSTFYEVIGTPARQHDAALTGWCPDWSSGATFLPPLFDGRNIAQKGNTNLAQINDEAINEKIDEIAAMTDVNAANAAYGRLDKQIMEKAPVVPLLYEKNVTVIGENVAGAYLHDSYSGGIDLVSVALKDPSK
ncbi:ABC transporter substrate-binding protein [Nonomuraea roseoviolacea]|uniref:Peptide/nickel transport system substrate-binding protein n=1 Tax=Nonomuraea roseoviolacea subsp. carminata TaxID=160689 RepID=A0ABT1JTM5_9ACTN|nr:ABC transporter substrate-binding protein [Nonomuraea roseoviolacea]MCP2345065.1 peptide/nickel transport system substrate-binding protein [Nonomuraea roseoviolacea subsp. carminata]